MISAYSYNSLDINRSLLTPKKKIIHPYLYNLLDPTDCKMINSSLLTFNISNNNWKFFGLVTSLLPPPNPWSRLKNTYIQNQMMHSNFLSYLVKADKYSTEPLTQYPCFCGWIPLSWIPEHWYQSFETEYRKLLMLNIGNHDGQDNDVQFITDA